MCSTLSPQQLLGKVESASELMVCDLEAGVTTLDRFPFSPTDRMVVVVDPTVNALEVGRRVAQLAGEVGVRVLVVANRVESREDRAVVEAELAGHEVVVVPDDPAIRLADRDGRAALDVAADGPGVRALAALAGRLTEG